MVALFVDIYIYMECKPIVYIYDSYKSDECVLALFARRIIFFYSLLKGLVVHSFNHRGL